MDAQPHPTRSAPVARWKLVLASLAVAIGIVGVAWGLLSASRPPDTAPLPAAIESIEPVRGAQRVPAQSEIVADMAAGFTGELTVDGVAIPTVNLDDVPPPVPGGQIDLPPAAVYEEGTATLRFRPAPDSPIAAWKEGEHTAVLRYWLITDGPGAARTFTWTFRTY